MKNWLQLNHNSASAVLCINQHWLTKKELDGHVNALVTIIRQHHPDEQDRIAVIDSCAWHQLLAMLACAKLSLTFFPLSSRLPEQSQQVLLRDAGIGLLLKMGDNPEMKRISPIQKQHSQLTNISLLIATSGSTGVPKAVMLSHQAVTSSAKRSNKLLKLKPGDCWLNTLPLHHIGGLSILIRTALAGAKMILHEHFDANKVLNDINSSRVTHISLVPVMLEKILDASSVSIKPPASLRVMLIGGAALDEKLADRALAAGWPLHPTYGMSEMASQVATAYPGYEHLSYLPLLAGVQARVLVNGQLKIQGSGKLYLKSDTMMSGYANMYNKAGSGLDENNWLITGDIATLDGDNHVQIIGRSDEVLIIGGENIHPAQVENIIVNCPGISRVCVLGIKDKNWGQKLCAIYIGSYNQSMVEKWSKSKLNGVFLPRCFLQVENMPELDNGKVDQNRLKKIVLRSIESSC